MAMLSSARSIGVIGSILSILVIVPGLGDLLAVIGLVLILIAVYQLSQIADDRRMFNNMLVAAALAIAGGVVAVVTAVLLILGSPLHLTSLNWVAWLSSLSHTGSTQLTAGNTSELGTLAVGVLGGLGIFWVFFLASAVFLRRGYDEIARRYSVRMFATAALVYLIGAILTIVVVGLVLVFVAAILQAVAFYSLPDILPGTEQRPVPMTVPPAPPSPPPPAAIP